MRFSVLVKKADFWLALAVLLLAAGGMAWSYGRIADWHDRITLGTDRLRAGEFKYDLLSAGKCVGGISMKLADIRESLEFFLHGELRIRLDNQDHDLDLNGDAGFNALGQLTSAIFTVSEKGLELGLGALEVSPIRLSLWVASAGVRKTRQFVLPGPVELKRLGFETYRLTYAPLANLQTTAQLRFLDQLRGSLQLDYLPREPQSAFCAQASHGRLDLTQAAKNLTGAQNLISSWLASPALRRQPSEPAPDNPAGDQ